MKKTILLLVFASFLSKAQTTINSPTVSGTWNVAGSPYIVNNNIQVPSTQTLIINPGVVVKFKPSTRLTVDGQLISAGTTNMPITYQAFDTLGWSNINIAAGGWEGIIYQNYSGSGKDNSIFDWCIVKDTKNKGMFQCWRGLKIHNSKFTHGNYFSTVNSGQIAIELATFSQQDTIDFNNCEVSDHVTSTAGGAGNVIYNDNFSGGYTNISNSIIKNNSNGGALWSTNGNAKIENNQLFNNVMGGPYGVIVLLHGFNNVNKNEIYKNTTGQYPAIAGNGGKATIDNNFIHNNNSTNTGICGSTSGGSGIALTCGTTSADSTYYLVRNNIVANNFRSSGSPMYIFNVKAKISNNHIINNDYSGSNSQMLMATGVKNNILIKNNIFYSKSPSGIVDSTMVIAALSGLSFRIENNYIPSKFYKSVNMSNLNVLVGDSNKNVIGITPQMIAPTANNSYTTDATFANFNLATGSPCINKGDTALCKTLSMDYLGNNRISGIIDIGAFEALGYALGIEQYNSEGNTNTIMVYPNPANDKITVRSSENELVMVSIVDILGSEQLLVHTSETQTEIDIAGLKAGIYFVRVIQNGKSFTEKLIINH